MPATVLTAAPPDPGSPPYRPVRARRLSRLLHRRWRPALAAASGLLAAAAFAPLAQPAAAPVAVAGLALSCRRARPAAGAVYGVCFGAAFFLPLLHWSATFVGAVPWLLLAASQTAFCAVLGAGLALLGTGAGWPLCAAGLWVAVEAARSRVPFGGFPWGRLAFSQVGAPPLRLAAIGGAPLVTFAVALTGALLALAVVSRGRRAALAVAAALGVALAGLAVPGAGAGPAGERGRGPAAVTVAVVQGNVPPEGLTGDAEDRAVLRLHVAATERLAAAVRAGRQPQPDLVVWPENSSDLDPFRDAEAAALIERAVRAVGVPVLVGAVLDAGRQVRNTGIVWNPVTGPGQVYDKRHPVPFAEYIPLRPLARLVTDKVTLVPRDFRAGRAVGVLQVGPARLGELICFEVAVDGLVRDAVAAGGRALVVQTNNATFGRSAETEQQLAMARLRAVEHRRTVLVAATSGISAVIDPTGAVTQRSGLFTPAVLVARVQLRDDRTPATRWGAGPEAALAAVGLSGLALAAVRRARRRTPAGQVVR